MMFEPNGTSGGRYSKMQTWLAGGGEPDLPADTFFLQGHDGQTIAVVPSLDLAVVRLGLTPGRDGFDVMLACCRFCGHDDKIVTKEPETTDDETEVQP